MVILRRVLLLWLFMFWQGGFFFYASVVVKVGTDLNGAFEQGLITQQVTIWLNLSGAITLAAWTADLVVERQTRLIRRWSAWLFMLAALGILVWLHPQMSACIDDFARAMHPGTDFYFLHRCYLYVSTAQWIASVAFSLWTLQNWRHADREIESPTLP